MNKFIYSLLIAGCILILTSCNETLEETETTSSLIANTDIAFDTYGYQQVNLYSVYSEYIYNLKVKSDETVAITLVVDESILDKYNELYDLNYEVLPSDYYSFTNTLSLNGKSMEVPITFNVEKIQSELADSETFNYILPLLIKPNLDTLVVNETMCEALIHVSLSEATLILEEPDIVELDDTIASSTLSLSAYYNFDGIDASKVSISVDESAVSDYNSENGTEYLLLPSDNYSYTGLTNDTDNSKLILEYEFATEGLEDTTYLLPLNISSTEYNTDETVFCKVKLLDCGLVFLGEYDLSVTENVDATYASTAVSIDLDAAAELFGITTSELEENISFYGINASSETLYKDGSTASDPGYWYDANGDVCSWGGTDCALFVEYSEGSFYVGQFPDYTEAWDTYTVSMALTYNGDMIRYNITLNVIPEYTETYEMSVSQDADSNYSTVQVSYDFAAVAAALGVDESELVFGDTYSFYGINSDGSLYTSGYTGNSGYWYAANGDVCSWGATDCALFAEYASDGTFNVGQFPDYCTSGDSYTVSMALVYGEKLVKLNITITIN